MNPSYNDDLTLSRRAVKDDGAFAEIMQRHGRLIYNVALRSAGSSEDAADIAQETFLKAWRSLSSFRGDCALSTWLCRIALSCACDHARAKKRRAVLSLTVPDENGEEEHTLDIPTGDVTALPEEEAIRQMEIAAVREAIAALPEDQRTIVMLRDIGGMSYKEIADTLGLELGTVKSRLNRARANVKDFLVSRNFFPASASNPAKEAIPITTEIGK